MSPTNTCPLSVPEVYIDNGEQITPHSDHVPTKSTSVGSIDENSRASSVDDLDGSASAIDYPRPSKRLKIAHALEKFRRVRDSFIRRSVFGWRVPFPCWQRFNGRFSVAEVLFMIIVFGLTIGPCIWGIVVRRPQPPRRMAEMAILFALAFATHNSLFNLFLGLPFDRRLFWHKLFAVSANILGWVHGGLAIWYFDGGLYAPGRRMYMWSGLVLGGVLLCFLIFSCEYLRRKFWNVFYALHLLMTLVLIGSCVAHHCYYSLIGVGLVLFDYVLRYVYMAVLAHPNDAEIDLLPSNITRLTLLRPAHFHYEAGQYVFLMIPSISLYEWHPFTLSSSPHTNLLTMHIRALGDWSSAVCDLAKKMKNKNMDDPENAVEATAEEKTLTVYIEGPYGTPEINVFGRRYKSMLLVGAGIGITPMQSIANFLAHEYATGTRNLNRVRFVWSTPDVQMLRAVFESDRQWAGWLNRYEKLSEFREPIGRLCKSRSGSISTLESRLTPTPSPYFQRSKYQRSVSQASIATASVGSLATQYMNNCEDVFRVDLHLTRAKGESDLPAGEIPDALRKYIKYGRPNYEQIFNQLRNEAITLRRRRVAVLVCGPTALVRHVQMLCAKHNAGRGRYNVQFDFHAELFEF